MIVNLKSIDAKFDWMSIEAHSFVSKIVRGSDDSSLPSQMTIQILLTSYSIHQTPTTTTTRLSQLSRVRCQWHQLASIPTEQVTTFPTHQHELNEEDGESTIAGGDTTIEVEYTASPTANVVAAVTGKPTCSRHIPPSARICWSVLLLFFCGMVDTVSSREIAPAMHEPGQGGSTNTTISLCLNSIFLSEVR